MGKKNTPYKYTMGKERLDWVGIRMCIPTG
jgi:hypothetical protein